MPHKLTDKNGEMFPGNIAFAPALLDPDWPVPPGIVGPDGKAAPKRFSVYRNNVVMSLMEAMGDTYPSISKLVGDENFATLSRIYISKYPPISPMMQSYGEQFSEFLGQFEPLVNSPFLVDVALLEFSWLEAYHAADAPVLDGAALGAITPDLLMETVFEVHPSTALVPSNYKLLELFQTRENDNAASANYDIVEHTNSVLITRPVVSVELCQLDHTQTLFFTALLDKQTLGKSVELATLADEEFDAQKAVTLLLSSGATTSISINSPL